MKVQANLAQTARSLGDDAQCSSSSSSLASNSNPKNIFSNIKVIQKINDSRFPVFLVSSLFHNRTCALKLFPYKDEKINASYLSESRFLKLSHPNVVKMLSSIDKQKSSSGGRHFAASCILMELAPHGDFADFLLNKHFYKDEILARTYFHQLIEGIEYLHSEGISHMDLKLENLLLGSDLKLKIADFDLSFVDGDRCIRGRGTCNYRPPEVMDKTCIDPKASDIYSAGVILFTFKTGGFPCLEDTLVDGHDLYGLMNDEDEKFWAVHDKLHKKKVAFDEDFKELFKSMVKANPADRATFEQIKQNKWYQGPTYTSEELFKKLTELGCFKNDKTKAN